MINHLKQIKFLRIGQLTERGWKTRFHVYGVLYCPEHGLIRRLAIFQRHVIDQYPLFKLLTQGEVPNYTVDYVPRTLVGQKRVNL